MQGRGERVHSGCLWLEGRRVQQPLSPAGWKPQNEKDQDTARATLEGLEAQWQVTHVSPPRQAEETGDCCAKARLGLLACMSVIYRRTQNGALLTR